MNQTSQTDILAEAETLLRETIHQPGRDDHRRMLHDLLDHARRLQSLVILRDTQIQELEKELAKSEETRDANYHSFWTVRGELAALQARIDKGVLGKLVTGHEVMAHGVNRHDDRILRKWYTEGATQVLILKDEPKP